MVCRIGSGKYNRDQAHGSVVPDTERGGKIDAAGSDRETDSTTALLRPTPQAHTHTHTRYLGNVHLRAPVERVRGLGGVAVGGEGDDGGVGTQQSGGVLDGDTQGGPVAGKAHRGPVRGKVVERQVRHGERLLRWWGGAEWGCGNLLNAGLGHQEERKSAGPLKVSERRVRHGERVREEGGKARSGAWRLGNPSGAGPRICQEIKLLSQHTFGGLTVLRSQRPKVTLKVMGAAVLGALR